MRFQINNYNNMKRKKLAILIIFAFIGGAVGCTGNKKQQQNDLLIPAPDHGFITTKKATKWEESLITGNGTLGALVTGDPLNERIILSHEKLFMPEYAPTAAPDLASHMDEIRSLVVEGKGGEAAQLAVELGKEVGIEELIWTNPLIPACQMEIEDLSGGKVAEYARSVNYETGEAVTAWKTEFGDFVRKVFASRSDQVVVMHLSAKNAPVNIRLKLAQLPVDPDEELDHEAQAFMQNNLIEDVTVSVEETGILTYKTEFKKKWDGSLKGYVVETRVIPGSGTIERNGEWLHVRDTKEILVLSRVVLGYDMPIPADAGLQQFSQTNYENLLEAHSDIHSEMFNRFSIGIEGGNDALYAEQLQNASSFGNMNNQLLNQLLEASRYLLISSTGEIPPTLQGIWGGTWRPAWSGDFTLNGNVPSAIASGLNTNFREVTESYMNYMYSMYDDFEDNAHDLYDAAGIFVPSRTSSDGKTYHFAQPYPHLFWYAGGAWTAQFFYDYWQYTGDDQFLKEKVIPLMRDAMAFYREILVRDTSGQYNFIPSYSPEIGPVGSHPVVINATMDVAAVKQLIRNLLTLGKMGYIDDLKKDSLIEILDHLPAYAIDEEGDLKEWIWPGLENDNSHRHASHLYPLFYEVDPEFIERPELIDAAKTAIEKRLEYRRSKNGAEMAFGLVQKGLAAAHIGDTRHAYECVDWLCHSYWSPVFTSYHDPMEIFNVDICGGLPALVTEMIIQSTRDSLMLLPALPEEWASGTVEGAGTRCGVTVDLVWEDSQPVTATFIAYRKTTFDIRFNETEWEVNMKQGETLELNFNQ